MPLVAEDGSGLANANSFCGVGVADAFWADRDPTALWGSSVDADKTAALIRASDYLRNQSRYRWTGTKKTSTQRMPWPRVGAVERDGLAVAENSVPWQVTEAASFLANLALSADLQPTLEHGGQVKSEALTGVVSITYEDKARRDAAYQFVDGLLAPLLRIQGLENLTPYQAVPTDPTGFTDGEFSPGSELE